MNQEEHNKVNCQTVLRIGKDIGKNVSLFILWIFLCFFISSVFCVIKSYIVLIFAIFSTYLSLWRNLTRLTRSLATLRLCQVPFRVSDFVFPYIRVLSANHIICPFLSPDLTAPDFTLRAFLKRKAYDDKPIAIERLEDDTREA